MTTERTRLDVEKLINFATKALQKVGIPEEDAKVTAQIMATAELRGVESHGFVTLVHQARNVKGGHVNARPKIQVIDEAPSTETIDGDCGLGFVVGHRAMTDAIRKAEKTGAGFVSVRNSCHFGAAAPYAMMALEHDMIGIAMTNTVVGVVAPGSTKPAVGTNPLAVAAPAGKKPPFVLDMATSVVAMGKLGIAQREGKSIPEGWAIDKEGKPLTDPTKRVRGEGGMLPLGGTPTLGSYKGFGLGVLVEILCGVLSGSSASILWDWEPGVGKGNPPGNHFFGALRIDSFIPVEKFKKSMDDMIGAMEALPTLPGIRQVYVAGGYEAEIVKDREDNGIPLHAKVIQDLQELAKELGIEYDFYR